MPKPLDKDAKKSSINWLWRNKDTARHAIGAAVGLGLLSGLLLIGQAWLLARVIYGVVIGGKPLSHVMPWLWIMLVIFVSRAALAWFSEQAGFHAAARLKEEIRAKLFRHLQMLGPAYLFTRHSGELTATLVDAVEALDPYYSKYLPQAALSALMPLSILVFVLPADWQSALVFFITGPLIPFFMVIIGKGAERLNQKQWRKLSRMSAHFLDVLQGLTTLKLFNVSRREAGAIAQISEEYRRSAMSVLRVAFLSSVSLEFFSTISIAIVAVWMGFRLLWGQMDVQIAFFILLLAPEFFLPLRKLGASYHARLEAVGAVQGILQILNTPVPSRPVQPKTIEDATRLSINFENVRFCYDGERPAVDEISFSIEAGETVALVGASGAGKSTIINLLLGFIRPQQGRIIINGICLEDLHDEHWLSHVAWVPQRPRIFHGTVAENIRLGKPGADAEEVIEAARAANAAAFIEQLPKAYETALDEGGRQLSGGQRQQIAIARAFLKDASLVILDEATAHLDPASQERIQAAMSKLAEGRSMLMIAHRLATVREADRIVVLHKGRIVEQGSHDDLLRCCGFYAKLIESSQGAP